MARQTHDGPSHRRYGSAPVTLEANDGSARLDPIQGVLEILDRASMTGTNKLGLLLTLLDMAPSLNRDNPCISRPAMAERYLEIHWEHATPYDSADGDIKLRQSSARKMRGDGTFADDTIVMQEVHNLRQFLEKQKRGDLCDGPLEVVKHIARRSDWCRQWDEKFATAVARVRVSLLKNPVQRLQKLPGKPEPFLYDLSSEASGLTLLPGVAESLTRFAAVLRPLVEFRFAQTVARINRINQPVDDVYSHLFGRDRIMPPSGMRRRLVEMQGGRCIFSGEPLPASGGSLDHVMPWSRIHLSQIENFLMTTSNVNSKKSDSLLAPAALEKWLHHVDTKSNEIQQCAQDHDWPADMDRVRRVARRIYEVVDPSTGVWDYEHGIRPLGLQGKRIVLKLLQV